MPSEAKLSVTLTEEMAAMIGRAVESGDYALIESKDSQSL